MNGLSEDREFPKLSERIPPDSPSSEEPPDNATNGTASNEESSSDEAPRQTTDQSFTRMNDESEEDDKVVKVRSNKRFRRDARKQQKAKRLRSKPLTIKLTYSQSTTHNPKFSKQAKSKNKAHLKQSKTYGKYGKGGKKRQRQQQRQKEKTLALEAESSFSTWSEASPDGGPLIRLREAIVVDWSAHAYDALFVDSASSASRDISLATWDDCETLPDPDLDKIQAARKRRRTDGISLEACLDEFEREEILSEQDMWFCPRCKEHRRASKKFDLWKTPDILIIHLKRFSSSGFRRDKLEVLVDFPLENLDVTSRVLHKEDGKQEVYDLIGTDCHWGGLGGGHYTSHAKNFVDGQWYSYNGMWCFN